MEDIITKKEIREKIRKILIGTLFEKDEKITDGLLDAIIKYYLIDGKNIEITNNEKKFLEEKYLDHIKKEGNKIADNIGEIEEITTLVSAFSYSNKNNLMEEFPFEKDLRIFPNIKKIYLLYTNEIRNKYSEYIKKSGISDKIEGIEIDGKTVNDVYQKIKRLVLEGKITKKNTILDITLGMKTISIAFYRISVERQIKAINWNEKFLNKYEIINDDQFTERKGFTSRISLSTKLNVMREPIIESLGIYSKINDNIRKGNYEVVSDFYKIIGIDDMAFFYRKLDNIFDIEEKKCDEFYKNVEKNIIDIYQYKQFTDENIEKIRNTVQFLLKLTIYSKKNFFEEMKWFDFINNKYGIKLKTEEEICSIEDEIDEFDKEKYYEYLKVKYRIIRTKEKISELMYDIEAFLHSSKKYIAEENEISNIEEIEDRRGFLIKLFEGLYGYSIQDNDIFESFAIEKELLEELKLEYKAEKLIIPNSNLENYKLIINLRNEKNLKKIVRNTETYIHKPILELLESINEKKFYVSSNEVERLVTVGDENKSFEDKKEEKTEARERIASQITKMRKLIDEINKVVKSKMSEGGIEVGDFIIYSKGKNKDYSIHISEEFII